MNDDLIHGLGQDFADVFIEGDGILGFFKLLQYVVVHIGLFPERPVVGAAPDPAFRLGERAHVIQLTKPAQPLEPAALFESGPAMLVV